MNRQEVIGFSYGSIYQIVGSPSILGSRFGFLPPRIIPAMIKTPNGHDTVDPKVLEYGLGFMPVFLLLQTLGSEEQSC